MVVNDVDMYSSFGYAGLFNPSFFVFTLKAILKAISKSAYKERAEKRYVV